MSDLREQLARRFYLLDVTHLEAEHAAKNVGSYDFDTDDAVREEMYVLADECIRQMEYARRSQELPDKSGYVVWKTPRPPLSLAPEDWKP